MAVLSIVLCLIIFLLYSTRNGIVESSHVVYEELKDVTPSTIDNKYRTSFHFQPKRNWLNDPNGPMYYNGVYHLFYQHNPKGAVWGNIVWAHSVSRDMINWKALPSALYPSKPFDINGCWSGSATILPGNKPVILYTGVDPNNRQVQNIAFPKNLSDPHLREWIKPDYNPIIDPDNFVNASAFRDPTTAWLGADGRYRIIIGSKRKHRGIAILYRSKDFTHWTRAQHPLHSANGTGMWECPDFYPVSTKETRGVDVSEYRDGLKYVLKNSLDLTRYEYYTIGSYRRDVDIYTPESTTMDDGRGLRYDYGNFYASKSFFDPAKKRRILWGWTNESDSRHDDFSKGWAGLQAIPRAVWLDSNKRQLIVWPVEEIETLRGKHISIHNRVIRSGEILEVSGIMTAQSDVEATFQLLNLEKAEQFDQKWTDPQKLCEQKDANVQGGVGPFGLLSLASGKREEQTAVFFRIFKDTNKYVAVMCHDPSSSTLRPRLYKPTFGGWVDINIRKNGKISLRNLIDHSVIESFGAGGRTCITSRVYPSLAIGQNAHLFVFNNGAEDIKITELNAWEMRKPYMNGA